MEQKAIYSKSIPALSQMLIVSSSHNEDCTSPICAFCKKNMQILDCPIPPPIVNGKVSANTCLWYGIVPRSVALAISNCSASDLASTRIPMLDNSMLLSKVGYQNKMSPLKRQSS